MFNINKVIMRLSSVPGWIWGVLFFAGLLSVNPIKDYYDTKKLKSRIVNNEPKSWRDTCLIRAHKQITDFQAAFKVELENRRKELMKLSIFDIRNQESAPSMMDFKNYGGLNDFFEASYEYDVKELEEVTEESRLFTNMLYDAYREYCISETACYSGGYSQYVSCMNHGPKWSASDWEYPIMWSLYE